MCFPKDKTGAGTTALLPVRAVTFRELENFFRFRRRTANAPRAPENEYLGLLLKYLIYSLIIKLNYFTKYGKSYIHYTFQYFAQSSQKKIDLKTFANCYVFLLNSH